jgi:hypothetical protein
MADKKRSSFFTKLRRLFSSNVIVRNTGGKKLKIVDTDDFQYTAKMKDKYGRLHSMYNEYANQYNMLGYQAARLELFRDYDTMEMDPIIASALDIYADESTTKNEYGDMLTISSPDENVKGILDNLFYDILNIDFNLWSWTRNMCKYGDCYLHLEIEPEYGIHNVKPISTYEMTRIEDMDPTNPAYVIFKQEGSAKAQYENYEIAHFRLLGDSNYIPYGKSMIESGRRVWKQLQLMEDAMLIHRVMRAPEKRLFYIDIGNIPPNEVDSFMTKVINKMKKVPFVDEQTGDYNLKFNMQNMTEDFFLPVRGGDSGTRIENLGSMTYDGTDDIEYLKNKMMAALKVPKAFLGYDEQITGKATLAAEDVRFARTIDRIQRILISELTKIAIVHLYSQGYTDAKLVDFKLELTNPSTIYEEERVRIWGEKLNTARDMMDARIFSREWIYDQVFGLTETEAEHIEEELAEDAKKAYRYETIQNEGEDPVKQQKQAAAVDGEDEDPMDNTQDNPDDTWGVGEFDPGKELRMDDNEKEISKRKNANKKYDHPDEKPFGRDPLGAKERSGPNERKTTYMSERPLKLESELKSLDVFLNDKRTAPKNAPKKIIVEEVITSVKQKDIKQAVEGISEESVATEDIISK